MNDKPFNMIVAAGGAITGLVFASAGKKKPTLLRKASYAALGIAGGFLLLGIIRKMKGQ